MRRASERSHVRRGAHERWLTFPSAAFRGRPAESFHSLLGLVEEWLPPGAGYAMHDHRDAEVVTYVLEGAIAQRDGAGGAGLVRAGEFQLLSTGRGVRHRERNASASERAHVIQHTISPARRGLEPGCVQKRFCAAERRGAFTLVVSPHGGQGSLCVHQDASLYSALLERGQHVVHALGPARCAWIHVVEGEAVLGDLVLATGDGAGIEGERAVSLTARSATELLLLDLAPLEDWRERPGLVAAR